MRFDKEELEILAEIAGITVTEAEMKRPDTTKIALLKAIRDNGIGTGETGLTTIQSSALNTLITALNANKVLSDNNYTDEDKERLALIFEDGDGTGSSSLLDPVADLAALKAIDTTTFTAVKEIQVQTLGLYKFQPLSTLTGDDSNVITPTTGSSAGRWIKQSKDVVETTRTSGLSWSGKDLQTSLDGLKPVLVSNSLTGKKVACLGSSVMAGEGLTTPSTQNYAALFFTENTDYTYIDRCIGGNTSQTGYNRFVNDVLSQNPEIVWLGFSPNNNLIYNGTTALAIDTALVAFDKWLTKLVALCEQKRIPYVISGMYPRGSTTAQAYSAVKKFNTMLAEKYGARYINFYGLLDSGTGTFIPALVQADNIHPTATGQTIMKNAIVPALFDYINRAEVITPRFNMFSGIKLGSDITTVRPMRNYTVDGLTRSQGSLGVHVKNPSPNQVLMCMQNTTTSMVSAGINSNGFFELLKDGVTWFTSTKKPIPNKYNRVVMTLNPNTLIFKLWVNGELLITSTAYSGFVFNAWTIGGEYLNPAKNAVGASFKNVCKWTTVLTDTDIAKDNSGVLLVSSLEHFHPLDYVDASTLSLENQGIGLGNSIVLTSTAWANDTDTDNLYTDAEKEKLANVSAETTTGEAGKLLKLTKTLSGAGKRTMTVSPAGEVEAVYNSDIYVSIPLLTAPTSTGITINGGSSGKTVMLYYSSQWDAGDATFSGAYLMRCGYDNNNYSITTIAENGVATYKPIFSQVDGVLFVAAAEPCGVCIRAVENR